METTIDKVNEARVFRLFELRYWGGMSRRRLGQAIGLSEHAIRRIERRQVVPDPAVFERAARALHADLDYLLHGTNRPDYAKFTEMRIKCRLDRLTASQLEDVAKLAEALLAEARRRTCPSGTAPAAT